MRLKKSKWFYIIVSELEKRGFSKGGGGFCCPNICSSYGHRNGTTIEIRGSRTLRVLRRGYEVGYSNLDLAAAIRIIEQAARNAG